LVDAGEIAEVIVADSLPCFTIEGLVSLLQHLDSNDAILVVQSATPGAWAGLSLEASSRLKENL
jgi:hypothetical protein